MAAFRVSTFDQWMKHQIDFKVRNKVRKAAKNGVVVREVPFDDALVQGISAIYNESPVRQGKRFGTTEKISRPCAERTGRFSTEAYLSVHFSKGT